MAYDVFENPRFRIVNNISRNMTVLSEQKKTNNSMAEPQCYRMERAAGGTKSIGKADCEYNTEDCTNAEDMERFIEQLRREHGADVSHLNNRIQNQERYESETLKILSDIFDTTVLNSSVSSCLPNIVSSEPIFRCSLQDIDDILIHISEPTQDLNQQIKSLCISNCGQEGLPSMDTNREPVVLIKPSPLLNMSKLLFFSRFSHGYQKPCYMKMTPHTTKFHTHSSY